MILWGNLGQFKIPRSDDLVPACFEFIAWTDFLLSRGDLLNDDDDDDDNDTYISSPPSVVTSEAAKCPSVGTVSTFSKS